MNVNTPTKDEKNNVAYLSRLFDQGVITKEDLRGILLKQYLGASSPAISPAISPDISPATPRAAVVKRPRKDDSTPNSPAQPLPQKKQRVDDAKKDNAKKRPGKPTTDIKTLRDCVRNATRRRFFKACQDPESALYTKTPKGKRRLNLMLFSQAAQDVIDVVVQEYPLKLRKVSSQELEKAIKWQVKYDRLNYLGGKPKRPISFGEPMPFDFSKARAELAKEMKECADEIISRSFSSSSASSCDIDIMKDEPKTLKNEPEIPKDEPVEKGKFLRPCLECKIAVWIGKDEDLPPSTKLAYPEDSEWTGSAQPYCQSCWAKEVETLQQLGGRYRCVGANKKTKDKKHVVEDPKKTSKSKKKQTPKPSKKQTPKPSKKQTPKPSKKKKQKPSEKQTAQPKEKSVVRWKVWIILLHTHTHTHTHYNSVFQHFHNMQEFVSLQVGEQVNAKDHAGRIYGAFVSCEHDDGTYDVYFVDDGTIRENIPSNQIKKPLMKGKTAMSWDDYCGKIFMDEGDVDEETGKYFEPGEFVVKKVITSVQEYECHRVTDDGDGEIENFDISHAISLIRTYEEV